MVGWHHWLNGHEFEQAPDGEAQGSLMCCSLCGHKESDRTEQLSNNNSFFDHKNELDLSIIPQNQNSLPPS